MSSNGFRIGISRYVSNLTANLRLESNINHNSAKWTEITNSVDIIERTTVSYYFKKTFCFQKLFTEAIFNLRVRKTKQNWNFRRILRLVRKLSKKLTITVKIVFSVKPFAENVWKINIFSFSYAFPGGSKPPGVNLIDYVCVWKYFPYRFS